jgi:uncharacterized protein
MNSALLNTTETYDGTQLSSLFAYLKHNVHGNSIVSWQGACNIPIEHIVDGEDILGKKEISGSDMVHFIIEVFDESLFFGVALQRLLVCQSLPLLKKLSPKKELTDQLIRKGDDLYYNDQKFNISIATRSPSSILIHLAVNNTNLGTPVPTIALKDFKISPSLFAESLMNSFVNEFNSIDFATKKVRWVN